MKLTLAVLVLVLIAGCGGGGDDPFDTKSYPKCSTVWVADKTLPKNYEGCLRSDGDIEAAVGDECADGKMLVVYDDTFWALEGGKVAKGATDNAVNEDAYKAPAASC